MKDLLYSNLSKLNLSNAEESSLVSFFGNNWYQRYFSLLVFGYTIYLFLIATNYHIILFYH